ncbi:hypothetical protein Micbo1qcDRAFT_229955 [Microdochium bolleyi]|uniref:Aminoglycoside phosphotransferase domain-containing protein n=1 Tax=Microdochium bolleyi TaxID=196109 RepID=A0A136JJE3_9PEZI|nr:hypothetical protein Micbo1qcDRAFT_229955 [Microdochium bolleyi]
MPPYYIRNQLKGIGHLSKLEIPTIDELVQLCPDDKPVSHLAYPPTNPTLWIKYGFAILWSEIVAQHTAYEGLQRLKSPVRVPRIFCAHGIEYSVTYEGQEIRNPYIFIVMEYIPGDTAMMCIQKQLQSKEAIFAQIANAIKELNRLPVPPDSAPSAVNGDRIRHTMFGINESPCAYQNVQQLEDHFNLFLQKTKRQGRVVNLANEPMIFCYSDIYLENFIIDKKGQVHVIDFADASYLPRSFQKLALFTSGEGLDDRTMALFDVASAVDIDNTAALLDAVGPMVIGFSSFVTAGRTVVSGVAKTHST